LAPFSPDFPPAVPDDAQPAFADGPPDFDLPPDDFFPPELSGNWERDWEAVGQHEGDSPRDPVRLPRHERIALLDWAGLEQGVAECHACSLCQQRTQAVLGVGDRNPTWLLIGEGPGQEEDLKGEPFVGQAGKLLDAMLAALELKRGDKVYIANAVKCRPPGNRTPTPEEMAFCRPFLKRQIQLLQPQVIVLLGKAAVQTMLDEHGALGALRGKRFEHQGIPVAVTYHPAYLLRNLPDKAKAWADLLFARRLLRQAMQTPAPARLP
jgi:DNA polymerase